MKIRTHLQRRPRGISRSTWYRHLKLNLQPRRKRQRWTYEIPNPT